MLRALLARRLHRPPCTVTNGTLYGFFFCLSSCVVLKNLRLTMFLRKKCFLLLLGLLLRGARGLFAVSGLAGVRVRKSPGGGEVDVGEVLSSSSVTSLTVFGTYGADFNMVEYGQRLKHYLPKLKSLGCERFVVILNGEEAACEKWKTEVEIGDEVQVLSDPGGLAGRAFGVNRGWLPDSDKLDVFGFFEVPMSPYAKLFGMLWGLGAWATLPAVIGGYLGNPFREQPWITEALSTNNEKNRWPKATSAQFEALPLVGNWKRRPLELATLRLQNMLGISLKYWEDLRPSDLSVLTQLGGCYLLDSQQNSLYEWRDPGICAVANFEDILQVLQQQRTPKK